MLILSIDILTNYDNVQTNVETRTKDVVMNLGEKLKAANEARVAAKNAAEVRKREESAAKFNRDNQVIINELEVVKASIIDAIQLDHTVKGKRLPTFEPFNTYGWKGTSIKGVDEAQKAFFSHPHFTALVSFFKWADENGLVGRFNYEHDGGGMESWYTATVEPK